MIGTACINTEHVATNHERWQANPAEQEDAP